MGIKDKRDKFQVNHFKVRNWMVHESLETLDFFSSIWWFTKKEYFCTSN